MSTIENMQNDIDLIVSWPRNCDYPVWRQMVRDNRHRFNNVIIVFTETWHGHDYREFIQDAMSEDKVIFLQSPPAGGNEDWRNVAVNSGLQHVTSKWVWFTEQDFFPLAGFWEEVTKQMEEDVEVIEVRDGARLHPCSLFMTRITLLRTQQYFGIVKDKLDHFGVIERDLWSIGQTGNPVKAYKLPSEVYHHMAGLSHNMRLISEGELPNHSVPDFIQYLYRCHNLTVPLDARFITIINNYLSQIPVKNDFSQ